MAKESKIQKAIVTAMKKRGASNVHKRSEIRRAVAERLEHSEGGFDFALAALQIQGVIERIGIGRYRLKTSIPPTQPLPVEEPPPPAVELNALLALVRERFPRQGQSNPFHFCLVAGLDPVARVGAVRHAFRLAVKEGLLEKLADGEEYRWCETQEPQATPAAPEPLTYMVDYSVDGETWVQRSFGFMCEDVARLHANKITSDAVPFARVRRSDGKVVYERRAAEPAPARPATPPPPPPAASRVPTQRDLEQADSVLLVDEVVYRLIRGKLDAFAEGVLMGAYIGMHPKYVGRPR